MENQRNRVRVARIGKPHGIKGEVTVELFTDSPETRFGIRSQLEVDFESKTSPLFSMLTVTGSRWHKNVLLVAFEEFSDRSTAETLRDSYLYAEPISAAQDEDAWYADELVGFTAHEESFEAPPIGKVTNLITGAAQDLLEIQLQEGREVLIPFVNEIVPEIDEERRAVVITPPAGLLELNQD
ncbi:ribosome maturation factor RimM [Enteractinococcus helveticum]|uniref:Ribosome maturation factor RimM n=1 Tax=Enteractinococcus helveticum TaxID=1837282 RepID=A0A1B7LVC1_9MICC|nr:ribosome maturation factor RimM [Enteractinococcus helveticum]OAV52180.1 hypothetical protein A6F49_00970 [Enteractinococcus helveticum]